MGQPLSAPRLTHKTEIKTVTQNRIPKRCIHSYMHNIYPGHCCKLCGWSPVPLAEYTLLVSYSVDTYSAQEEPDEAMLDSLSEPQLENSCVSQVLEAVGLQCNSLNPRHLEKSILKRMEIGFLIIITVKRLWDYSSSFWRVAVGL